jgi:hypothetical protein
MMVAIPASAPKPSLCNTVAETIASTSPETRIAIHEPKARPTISVKDRRTLLHIDGSDTLFVAYPRSSRSDRAAGAAAAWLKQTSHPPDPSESVGSQRISPSRRRPEPFAKRFNLTSAPWLHPLAALKVDTHASRRKIPTVTDCVNRKRHEASTVIVLADSSEWGG